MTNSSQRPRKNDFGFLAPGATARIKPTSGDKMVNRRSASPNGVPLRIIPVIWKVRPIDQQLGLTRFIFPDELHTIVNSCYPPYPTHKSYPVESGLVLRGN